jgi:predicted acylesterase/phospholipase RssA
VAGTSAGSIIAALIGAGASPEYLRKRIEEIDYGEFLAPFAATPELASRGWLTKSVSKILPGKINQVSKAFYEGALHSSEYIERFVEDSLRELTGKRSTTFSDLILPTYVVATDVQGRNAKVWDRIATPDTPVAYAVRASCSIPFFFPPVDDRYVDGGLLANLPTFVFFEHGEPATTRVLAFGLMSSTDPESCKASPEAYVKAIVDTVIDGAGELQRRLFSVSRVLIDTGDVAATDFDKVTPEINVRLADFGATATREFFRTEHQQLVVSDRSGLLPGMDEVRSVITERLNDNVSRVDIVESDTDYLYKLFPSILYWRLHGIPITSRYPAAGVEARGEVYRRNLLPLLGVKTAELQQAPAYRGYFFNGPSDDGASAIIGPIEKVIEDQDAGTFYSGLASLTAVRALFNAVGFPEPTDEHLPTISAADQRTLLERICKVRQYVTCQANIETVHLSSLSSLTPYVHEFKYRQIPKLIEIYQGARLQLFDPAQVNLSGSKSSLITPPVIEVCGDALVLIEGTTRATWLLKNGFDVMRAIVVKGVTEPLPGDVIPLQHVRVVHNSKRDVARYGDKFKYAYFRRIEETVHLDDDVK